MNIFLQCAQSIKYCLAVLIVLSIKADVIFFLKAGSVFLLADHKNSFINSFTPRTTRTVIHSSAGINKSYQILELQPQVIKGCHN